MIYFFEIHTVNLNILNMFGQHNTEKIIILIECTPKIKGSVIFGVQILKKI